LNESEVRAHQRPSKQRRPQNHNGLPGLKF
jgi:hypothetical protein